MLSVFVVRSIRLFTGVSIGIGSGISCSCVCIGS